MNFTVILLRPDHATDNYGQDTYLAWVKAADVADAVRQARLEASLEDDEASASDDFFVLAVFHGHLDDVNPGV